MDDFLNKASSGVAHCKGTDNSVQLNPQFWNRIFGILPRKLDISRHLKAQGSLSGPHMCRDLKTDPNTGSTIATETSGVAARPPAACRDAALNS